MPVKILNIREYKNDFARSEIMWLVFQGALSMGKPNFVYKQKHGVTQEARENFKCYLGEKLEEYIKYIDKNLSDEEYIKILGKFEKDIQASKHKKILKAAKGYRGARSRLVKTAKEALMHAGEYAFAGRRQRKRQKRTEWITSINAALSDKNISYSEFIKKLKEKDIALDRKILAQLAIKNPTIFEKIVNQIAS